ncbi:MAG: RsmF rRNA methyltransferase first C-terminal domain-containing protein [Anaerolineaceae bacterium]|nr:RsmF rRNA methyltransferase first C-terminal domain-containing protein [Anaerolineaceae bacterium]
MSINPHAPPPDFMARMAGLLGEEFAQFARSYEAAPAVGLRVNTLKLSAADFSTLSPFALKAVGPHEPDGFLVTDGSKPGSHPYHAAGLYYLQEPSAMVVGGIVAAQPGELVLDLAAAPGGKATHLAAQMQGRGLLVANDIHTGRARLLAENMTRWGAANILITSAEPEHLAAQFGPIFDRVLVDAPCSGEGMLRKLLFADKQGPFEWSEGMVLACARRQTAVLHTAAGLVKPGGRLVYATCTFAPEENEAVIAQFLGEFPQFELVDPPRFDGFGRGRPSWIDPALADEALEKCVRLWPHQFPGEGHFIAVMQRTDEEKPAAAVRAAVLTPPGKKELAIWRGFAREALRVELAEERLLLANGRLYLLPEAALATGKLHLIRYGLLLGELGKGHFRPDHALALALKPEEAALSANFAADSDEIAAYWQGLDLPSAGPDGWLLVAVDGFVLGWGKRVNGRVKNHYPRGLRWNGDWRLGREA